MICADAILNNPESPSGRLSSLPAILSRNIIGQDHVLGQVEAVLRRGELGLMVKTIRRLAGFLMVLSVLMIVLSLNWELKLGHRYKGCPTRTPLLAGRMPADC